MNRWRERVNSGEIRQDDSKVLTGDANAYFDRLVEQHLANRNEIEGDLGAYDEERHLEHWQQVVSDHTFNGDVAHDLFVLETHIHNCLVRGQYDRAMITLWLKGLAQIRQSAQSVQMSPTTSDVLQPGSQCSSFDPEIGWDRDDRIWVACRNCNDVWYPKNQKWKNVRKAVKEFGRDHGE